MSIYISENLTKILKGKQNKEIEADLCCKNSDYISKGYAQKDFAHNFEKIPQFKIQKFYRRRLKSGDRLKHRSLFRSQYTTQPNSPTPVKY